LGALARLRVLARDGAHGLVLAGAREVLARRPLDADLRGRGAGPAGERLRALVPKQGTATARTPETSRPRAADARTATSSASAESSPPESPTAAVRERVCPRACSRSTSA
jgi:hypothetical protein